jgi:hypothetical protein
MVDFLSRGFEYEQEIGNVPRLLMVQGAKPLNHSHFVDDTLFLREASQIIETRFKVVLDSFLDASGGAVNHRKCQIIVWNTRTLVLQNISCIFHFPYAEN